MDSHVEIKSHTSGCLKDELNSRNITGGHLLGRLIVAFERLQQLIQPKTVEYMPLAEENNEIGQDARQVNWQGRMVSKVSSVDSEVRGLQAETGAVLKQRLKAQYGRYIQQTISGKVSDNKQLDQCKVLALEEKAHRLLHSIQSANKKKLKSWITNTNKPDLLVEQFEKLTGYRWDSVTRHEQQQMIDQVSAILLKQPEKLSKSRTSRLIGCYLQNHRSNFSRVCSQTSQLLASSALWEEPLLVEHLREWAEQKFQDDSTSFAQNDLQMVKNFQFLVNESLSKLTTSGLELSDDVSYKQQISQVQQLLQLVVQAQKDLKCVKLCMPQAFRDAMAQDLQRLEQTMSEVKDQLTVNQQQDPRNPQQWQKIKQIEVSTARQVLKQEIALIKQNEKNDPTQEDEKTDPIQEDEKINLIPENEKVDKSASRENKPLDLCRKVLNESD